MTKGMTLEGQKSKSNANERSNFFGNLSQELLKLEPPKFTPYICIKKVLQNGILIPKNSNIRFQLSYLLVTDSRIGRWRLEAVSI